MKKTVIADESLLSEIMRIENESFSPPWSEKNVYQELITDDSIFLARLDDGTVCGFLIAKCAFDEAELYQLAVSENRRRTGNAAVLMDVFIERLTERKVKRVFLEVRKSNIPAVSLYEKYGFKTMNIRKNYYSAPVEDALIMEKILISEQERIQDAGGRKSHDNTVG